MSDSPTVTIRGQRSDDWENLYALLNEPDIIHDSLLMLPYLPEDGFRDYLGGAASATQALIAEASQPSGRKRIVGAAWLHSLTRRRRHTGQLSMVVHPDYRGGQVALSLLRAALDLAENWLGLRRIEMIVYADELSSLAFYEEHGFEREAALRRYALRAGAYHDAFWLARLNPRPDETAPRPAPEESRPAHKEGRLAITIRGIEEEDWEDVAAMHASGNVVYHTLQLPYQSRDAVRDSLENLPDDTKMIVAVVKDQVVGRLGLHLHTGRRAHAASLGMMVHADFQGRGVGTALVEVAVDLAENWLNVRRIELECYTDNAAGLHLYQKFGFEIEGTLRRHAFRNGQFVDSYAMARIRSDES
jgi:putative acetyltransferase